MWREETFHGVLPDLWTAAAVYKSAAGGMSSPVVRYNGVNIRSTEPCGNLIAYTTDSQKVRKILRLSGEGWPEARFLSTYKDP